jgi:uncharacterized membrane protein (DUF4010 family)
LNTEVIMQENIWLLMFLSLALGMLVGLQRESVDSKTAGIRTFPLITILGTICGLLSKEFNPWILAAGFIAITALLIMGNLHRIKIADDISGITTEVAVLLMFAIGAYLVYGQMAVAVVLTGIITVLLHFKTTLHRWVDKIGDHDLRAIMQFVLISMVVLPVLPDTTYDNYEAFNPRETWFMVVLIVGIGLAGYFLYKIWGDKAGVLLGGILGGLISSTATTLAYAKKASGSVTAAKLAAFVILTASAVSMGRVLVEISVVAPSSFTQFVFPLAAEGLIMVLMIFILCLSHRKEKNKMPEQGNPAELKGAIIFAILYAAITYASAFVKDKFGDSGLYVVSIISGLTDLDAITLSTAKMTEQKHIEATLGWRLILLAVMSNLVFKAGLAWALGGRVLGRLVAMLFGILVAAGLAIFFLWPA